MKRCRAQRSGVAAGVLLLLPWLLVGSDPTGRAAEDPSHRPGQILSSSERAAAAAAPAYEIGPEAMPGAGSAGERAGTDRPPRDPVVLRDDGSDDGEPRVGLHTAQPGSGATPDVAVRVGDHGDYERVVFEWPEGIAYDLAQHGDQVTVAFSRAGRIDFSAVRDRLGRRVLGARTAGADATRRVVLRVAPDAAIRSFSLEDERIVVIDVLDGSAAPRPAPPAPALRAVTSAIQEQPAPAEASVAATRALSLANDAPPAVAVRVGDHGPFERIVFEWPEAIGHEVVQRADRVTVVFSRPGTIDFSAVRDRFGERLLEALADGGDATSEVTLRVVPNAEIRSFSLKDDRVVVVDVVGGSTAESLAQPASDAAQDPIGELRRQLEQRDAVIDGLLARVEQLERGGVLSGDDLDRVVAGRAPPPGDPSLPHPGAPSRVAAAQPSGGPASQQETPPTGDAQGGESTAAQAQPGQIQVDEDEIDRALERTLVQSGVLLLPLGQAEVEPYFSYTRDESDASMVVFAENGLAVGAEVDVRRNEFVSGQTLRFGMPFDSQVEFGFPYRFVDQSMVASVNTGGSDAVDGFGHGMGDMSIGVAKTLMRENGGWWPDLVGRITWDSATGKTSSNDVALGGGFHELRGSLSAVKRQDPLAFVGGVSYETTFEKDDVKPGDQLGFSIGTVLAASPGTSLRLALDQRFVDTAKSNGEGINGSDFVSATATLGASVVLGPGVLLDVAADIGLTDAAPDYAARASLPIRFNLPVY